MSIAARNSSPIIISGAGIGGLACALALAQRQFKVIVCEQASQFGEIGAGLQVAPNALSVLDALGVGQKVKKKALLIERIYFADGLTDQVVCDIPCDDAFNKRFSNPYAVAYRMDVHGALLDACREAEPFVTLMTNSRVIDYQTDGATVAAITDAGSLISGSAFIAADGLRSRIRQKLIGDGEPKLANAVIYRALIPASKMPASLQRAYPTLWLGPDAHVIYYPVRDWTEFNLGATVSKATEGLPEGPATADEVMDSFGEWNETVRQILGLSHEYKRYVIRHRDPVDNWSDGIVTLLGDAAHPMVQYIAQGAAMALEDAICLADRVDAMEDDFAQAFREYQDIRILRSARMQISSLALDRIYHARGVERLVRNTMFVDRTPAECNERLSWIFESPDYVRDWQLPKGIGSYLGRPI